MATRWTSKHTGQKIDDTIDYVCNPNLLDNCYFGNPVNQRGQMSYTAAGYGIDRWRIGSAGTLTIEDGYITFASSDATLRNIEQVLETLEVGKYTISLLAENAAGTNLIIGLVSGFTSATISTNEKQVVSLTFDVTTKTSGTVYIQTGNSQIKLYAAKLELGSQQTLAHRDADGNWVLNEIPDYGEQLARCQRHQLRVGYKEDSIYSPVLATGVAVSSASIRALIPTPVTMRENPVISFFGSDTISTIHAIGNGVSLTPTAIDARVNSNGIFLNLTVSGATVNETYAITLDHARGLMLNANL